jgi:phosphatidylglycerol:prolipoprotein diacylglycerol transferase
MYPILFQFGPITLYSFGAFMALAFLTAAWIVHLELQRTGYDPELSSSIVIAAAVGGFAGARVLFIFEEWSGFLRSPWDYIFTGAGFTWYGGLLGGVLSVSWVVAKKKIPWRVAADIVAPAAALGYGVGRIGCHVAGDGDWGTVTDMPWGVAYTKAIIGWVDPSTGIPYPPGVRVHPTPIYEFIESLIIFGILWSLRKKDYPAGTMFWLCLILTGLARFAVEFWRINPVIGLGLTEAQWFGLAFAAVGSIQLARGGA